MTIHDPTDESRQESDEQADETSDTGALGSEGATQIDPATLAIEAWYSADDPETNGVDVEVATDKQVFRLKYDADGAKALGEKIAAAGRLAAGEEREGDR
jgi:hypothetical protein